MQHRHLLPNEIDLLVDGDTGFGVQPLREHVAAPPAPVALPSTPAGLSASDAAFLAHVRAAGSIQEFEVDEKRFVVPG